MDRDADTPVMAGSLCQPVESAYASEARLSCGARGGCDTRFSSEARGGCGACVRPRDLGSAVKPAFAYGA